MAPWMILVMVRFVFCYIFLFFPNPDELGYFIAHPERCAWPNGNEQTFSMHVVPLSDLTFISMATKRPSPSKKSNYSGEDADGVGDVVESDGEEEGACLNLDVGWKSKLFPEHLDVPAAEYLNSLGIQGRLFSNFREKELVIFVVNDAPDQSFVFRVTFGLEVHSFWIPTGWYHKIVGEPYVQRTVAAIEEWRHYIITTSEKHPICLVMKSSQDVFNGIGAKVTDQLQLAPIFPAHTHLPNLLPFFGAFQKAQELSLFNLEAPIQPDGTAIVILSNITSIFGRNGGPVAVTTPETPAASNPITKSGALPKRPKVKMRNLWLHVPNTCASVDETDQQEAMQALPENFEMTESFTIWKPEDETSMQLFQI
ncbi:hypothetical protein B0H14DRAFT_2603535 [Mycena olivaceomarginata]|nr:hypothetical protein B0H14DRAFT_2603535 [Mycena olivaceomarginata]